MAQVKFVVDIAFEVNVYPNGSDEKFLDESLVGKPFMYKDPIGSCMVFWITGFNKKDNGDLSYANFMSFPLPQCAVYNADEDKDDSIKKGELFDHIQQCCDKTGTTVQHWHDSLYNHIKKESDRDIEVIRGILEEYQSSGGNGISEKTLLEALKIVSEHTKV